MKLYRPVGEKEMDLIRKSDFTKFPPRLAWQPIFYPVLNEKYACEIAEKWNTRDADNGNVGYVTSFEIPDDYYNTFTVNCVGMPHHVELWVPSDKLNEFNDKIVGKIAIEKVFRG